jgi:hypothetical protein
MTQQHGVLQIDNTLNSKKESVWNIKLGIIITNNVDMFLKNIDGHFKVQHSIYNVKIIDNVI